MNKKDKRRSSIHDITSAGLPGGQDITGAQTWLPADVLCMMWLTHLLLSEIAQICTT